MNLSSAASCPVALSSSCVSMFALSSDLLAPVEELETPAERMPLQHDDPEPRRRGSSLRTAVTDLKGPNFASHHQDAALLHGMAAAESSSSKTVPRLMAVRVTVAAPDSSSSSWLQRHRSQQRRHSTQALALFAGLSSRATMELQQLERMSRNKQRRQEAQEDGTDAAERERDSGSGNQAATPPNFRPVKSLPVPNAGRPLLRNASDKCGRTRHALRPRSRDLPDLPDPAFDNTDPALDTTSLTNDSSLIATHLTSHLTSPLTSHLTSNSPKAARLPGSIERHLPRTRNSDHSHMSRARVEELLSGAAVVARSGPSMRSLSSSCNEPCLATTLELSSDERPPQQHPHACRSPSRTSLSPAAPPPFRTSHPTRWPSTSTSSRCDSPASPFSPALDHRPPATAPSKLHLLPMHSNPHRSDPSTTFTATPSASISAQSIADISHVHVRSMTDHRARSRWSSDYTRVLPVDREEEEASNPPRGSGSMRSLRTSLRMGGRSQGSQQPGGGAAAAQAPQAPQAPQEAFQVLLIPVQPVAGTWTGAGPPPPPLVPFSSGGGRALPPRGCTICVLGSEEETGPGSSSDCSGGSGRRLRRSVGRAGRLPPYPSPVQLPAAGENHAPPARSHRLIAAPFSSTHLSLLMESLQAVQPMQSAL